MKRFNKVKGFILVTMGFTPALALRERSMFISDLVVNWEGAG